ncbi:xanthine dehydrogenase family protein molybdopterin-binding subunit [Actinomadura welshii]|uniref:xanthine dehydrogenase family protein molybdopterin-binding subunit n=1 Tax=Actinomadura welshii TaxID=3103817 RepID=UPI0003AD44D8|nr:xanthine dehydrogenase family protein molybdopterin-binding subunit [Actinomadura madurae]
MTTRIDGPLKVTGRARYGADHNLPDMLHGHVVTSTIANGEILAMEVATAKAAPGVVAVYSPFDPLTLRTPSNPMMGATWVPLQDRNVTYYGQPVAFVVARTYEQARDAAALVEVSYEERPAHTSLVRNLDLAEDAPPGMDGTPSTYVVLAEGVESVEEALAASPVVIEGMYYTAGQNHAAIEPHSAVAVWDDDGLMRIYSGNQGASFHQGDLAAALDVEPSSVQTINPFVGGAFGGKGSTSTPAFLAAAASRVLGRPVKAALSREQVFTATANRPETLQRIALGATRDGTLTAMRHDSWCSAATDLSFVETTSVTSREAYRTPNLALSQKVVPLHIPRTTFMRAPGEASGSFALESAMDELAVALNLDPIELRLRNSSIGPAGSDLQWSSKHLDDCYRIGAERFAWSSRTAPGKKDGDWLVGMGTATARFPALRLPATTEITLRADDTALVSVGGADPGTGLLTVMALLGAEALDIAPERITPRLGRSAYPPGGLSGASTATASVGSAIMVAASAVLQELQALASAPGAPFAGLEVTYARGRVLGGGRSMTFGGLLSALGRESVSAIGSSGPGEELTKHAFSSFGAQFCEVRVHPWTREIRVSRMLGVFDAGRIVNDRTARSQLMGGMIWGVSAALHEGLEFEETGRLANADLAGYLVPVNADIPEIDVHFVQHPDTLHNPIGARGIGEIGVVGMAAAVANAVYNATGIRVRRTPIRIEDLLEA